MNIQAIIQKVEQSPGLIPGVYHDPGTGLRCLVGTLFLEGEESAYATRNAQHLREVYGLNLLEDCDGKHNDVQLLTYLNDSIEGTPEERRDAVLSILRSIAAAQEEACREHSA